ncbi:MAG TPA: hypothetical protein VF163_17340 [Micromonosporaceae bacterium]
MTPVIAYAMSLLGFLLGLLMLARARHGRPGRFAPLHLDVALAMGGVGVWLAEVIHLLGLSVPDTALRHDPLLTITGLVLCVALFSVGLRAADGTPGFWRLLLATSAVGAGLAACHYLLVASIRIAGSVSYHPGQLLAPAALAVATAIAILWWATAVRGLPGAALAAAVLALGILATHHTGMSLVRMHVDRERPADVRGIDPSALLGPAVLVGVAILVMLAYFRFGNSTAHDLRVIYSADPDRELDPQTVHMVQSRVAVGIAPAPRTEPLPVPRQSPRPRPTPGTRPTWQLMPVWGSSSQDRPSTPDNTGTGLVDRDEEITASMPPVALSITPEATTYRSDNVPAVTGNSGSVSSTGNLTPSRYPPANAARRGTPRMPQETNATRPTAGGDNRRRS